MLKRTKVVMLPTNEKSKLFKGGGTLQYLSYSVDNGEGWRTPQHLYITSDDEIKEGDWYIDDTEEIRQSITSDKDYWSVRTDYKKIIATTDSSLKILGSTKSKINDVEYETFVGEKFKLPQPSQSFIQKYVEEYNKVNQINDVMVEYEIDNFGEYNLKLKLNPKNNTITIKQIKDNYSKKEVEELLQKLNKQIDITSGGRSLGKYSMLKWIEENL